MPSDIRSTIPTEPGAYEGIGLGANWNEHVVTIVATGIGVLIVALIAVLMGLA